MSTLTYRQEIEKAAELHRYTVSFNGDTLGAGFVATKDESCHYHFVKWLPKVEVSFEGHRPIIEVHLDLRHKFNKKLDYDSFSIAIKHTDHLTDYFINGIDWKSAVNETLN